MVESASKYVTGKHQILTTMNISGSRIIHVVIVFCLPPPSVWHLSFISKSSQNWRQDLFQMLKLYRRTRTPSWLLSISGVIRILMRVIRLTNGKPCRCGYMIFMTWVISLNNLSVMFLFVLRFYGPVNPKGSCRARSVYLTTRLLGRLSPLSG